MGVVACIIAGDNDGVVYTTCTYYVCVCVCDGSVNNSFRIIIKRA